jgi:pimeloyl-ACP methyl ester carboxylesterase
MRFLVRAAFAAALLAPPLALAQTAPIAGEWYGTLDAGVKLPLIFHIKADGVTAVDSPAQGAKDLPGKAVLTGGKLRIDLTVPLAAFEGEVSADGKTLTGQWLQGGGKLPLVMTKDAPVPLAAPNRPQTPKPPFPYRAEDVTYLNPASGLKLAGTLTLPPGKGPFPVALLITGSGIQDRDETIGGHKPFLVLADALTRKGVAVLRVDDRGAGGSQAGDLKAATTADFVTDVQAGVSFLRGRADIDPDRVGLIGHSEGGLIAPIAAAKDPKIAFLVLMAGPGVPGEALLRTQARDVALASGAPAAMAQQQTDLVVAANAIVEAQADPAQAKPKLIALLTEKGIPSSTAAMQAEMMTSAWYRQFLTLDPAGYLAQVRAPVLAVNGAKDTQVSAEVNLPAIKAALTQSQDVTTTALPGLNHLVQTAVTGAPQEYGLIEETLAPSALGLIVDWTVAHAVKP